MFDPPPAPPCKLAGRGGFGAAEDGVGQLRNKTLLRKTMRIKCIGSGALARILYRCATESEHMTLKEENRLSVK